MRLPLLKMGQRIGKFEEPNECHFYSQQIRHDRSGFDYPYFVQPSRGIRGGGRGARKGYAKPINAIGNEKRKESFGLSNEIATPHKQKHNVDYCVELGRQPKLAPDSRLEN